MPDLTELLAAELRRMEAPAAPEFDTLVVRAGRRRRRRAGGAVLGAVVLVAAVVVGSSLAGSQHPTAGPGAVSPSATALPVSPAVYARLREMAFAMASGNGDEHPTQLEAVAVDDARAADDVMSGDVSSSGLGVPGYVIEVRGSFVCGGCSTPSGAQQITGTVVQTTVMAGSFQPVGFGMGKNWTDLHRLGTPFSLTTPTSVAPVPVVTVSEAPASVAPATESSGPAAPDPTTLAEAEARTRASTLDPTKATIELAAKTTAGQLRVAGLVIPAAVRDTTQMFVVVVNGSPIFPNGVGKDGKRASEFAVVFNTDGTGLGAQVVYHGAFGLPDAQPAPTPVAQVVAASQLATAANLGFVPALGQTPGIAVAAAVATARTPSLARPLAALVYIDTAHVTHRLAWVIQTDCVPFAAIPPHVTIRATTYLGTSQVVIDATTGKQLVSATF